MQQAFKTAFLKSLFPARRQAKPAAALQTLDRAALRRVAGGTDVGDTPKGGW